jgi:hypothetical protein
MIERRDGEDTGHTSLLLANEDVLFLGALRLDPSTSRSQLRDLSRPPLPIDAVLPR